MRGDVLLPLACPNAPASCRQTAASGRAKPSDPKNAVQRRDRSQGWWRL